MPLAQYLTELHGGAFHLTSKVGVGTEARVHIPASRVSVNDKPGLKPAAAPKAAHAG